MLKIQKESLLSGESVDQTGFHCPGDESGGKYLILSKSSDLVISDKAIALKTEIEKVREQIQNIE